jgi:hypothetical protein
MSVRPEEERDPIAEDEAEAAASEAAEIGGPTPDDPVEDPAQRPLVEAGEGEAEGFELAEEDLRRNASHDDGAGNPFLDRFDEHEDSGADPDVYGEADDEEVDE